MDPFRTLFEDTKQKYKGRKRTPYAEGGTAVCEHRWDNNDDQVWRVFCLNCGLHARVIAEDGRYPLNDPPAIGKTL